MLELIVSQLKKSTDEARLTFYTEFQLPYKGLSIHVDPIGEVTFPVTAKMAKSLIVEAEPARYGLRDKTLLDKEVRDTWEIPKHRITTSGEWQSQIEEALLRVRKDLNLPDDGKFFAELHNLLIYMPGQFFKSHQDSEKTEGMLATLAVLLPSEFTGGDFVIDQHGDKKIFESSKYAKDSLVFTAFYADCHHEVKEVTSGYRLALTYNLIFLAGQKPIPTNRNLGLENALKSYFSSHSEKGQVEQASLPRWFVYLLDHEYTRNSLDWPLLRGVDRDRAGELLACADQLNLTSHLALADIHETWSTEGGDDWGSSSRRRWHYEEEDEEVDPDDYTLEEKIEDEIVLRHWVSRSGEKFEQWEKCVPNDIVCWTKAVDQFKPFKSQYEGYMGNYGNTLDRWYHRAAVILWKNDTDMVSLFSCDKVSALQSISETLKKDIKEGHRAVEQILPCWPEAMHRFIDPSIGLEFANVVGSPELASSIAKTLGMGSLRVKNLPLFINLIDLYGEGWLITVLNSWRKNREFDHCDSISNELEKLVSAFVEKYRQISNWILQDQLSLLFRGDALEHSHSGRKQIRENLPQRLKIVKSLINVCRSAGEFELREKLVSHLMRSPSLYPETALVNLFLGVEDPALAPSLLQLRQRLQKQIRTPRKEGDWSIKDTIPHNCSDCRYLKDFLESTSTQKLVWPLAKDRRAHIHQVIESMDIPVTHETLHQGSPHKLVLTKTSELFERDREQAESIELCLANLGRRNDD